MRRNHPVLSIGYWDRKRERDIALAIVERGLAERTLVFDGFVRPPRRVERQLYVAACYALGVKPMSGEATRRLPLDVAFAPPWRGLGPYRCLDGTVLYETDQRSEEREGRGTAQR